MRICSFLPSGTEILFALGLADSVVGVTFECDYPPEARTKPVVVYSKLPPNLPEREIDRQVNASLQAGESLYRLDAEKLERIQPDLIVTQDLCHSERLGRRAGTTIPEAEDTRPQPTHCRRRLERHPPCRRGRWSNGGGKRTGVAYYCTAFRVGSKTHGRSSARPVPRVARPTVCGWALGAGDGSPRGWN